MERNGKAHDGESDMDLLFAPPPGSLVERGAAEHGVDSYSLFTQTSSASFGKSREDIEPKLQRDFEFSPIPELDDLSFAVRHIVFDGASQQEVFNHAVDFVHNYQADQPNFEVLPNSKKVLGCLFEETHYACYCLQLFRHADTLGLSCNLSDGSAPTLEPFWKALRQTFVEANFIAPKEDEIFEEEDDDLFFDSDTEDGDSMFDLSMPSMKFLDLREDQTIIESWVQDIQDPNFSQEILLSLSFNCQSETNLQILANNYAQDLFDSVIASMSSNAVETLPSVRSACVFLAELSKFSNVKVTEGNIKVLIDQLEKWALLSQSQSSQSQTTEVMRSQEVATLLAKCILPKFSELVSGVLKNIRSDVLEKIQKETEYDEVKYHVDRYRQTLQPVR